MDNNLIGLDLLVNNKKTYKKNDPSNDLNLIKDIKNDLPLDKDIKNEILNIVKEKNSNIFSLSEEDKSEEIDIIIDNMINTLIDVIKYKYFMKKNK